MITKQNVDFVCDWMEYNIKEGTCGDSLFAHRAMREICSMLQIVTKERETALQDLIEKEREKEALLKVALDQRDAAIKENAELKRWRDAYRELAMRLFSYLEPGIYRIPATYGEEIDAEAKKILQERGR